MNLLENQNLFLWRNVISDIDQANFEAMLKGKDYDLITQLLGLPYTELLQKLVNQKADIDPRTYTLLQLVTNQHPIFEIRAFKDFKQPLAIEPPTPQHFKEVRQATGIKQLQLSKLLRLNRNTVKEYDKGEKRIPVTTWTLFLLATAQHPYYEIILK
jgi:DNA-binding transcriptional regulator YiaG